MFTNWVFCCQFKMKLTWKYIWIVFLLNFVAHFILADSFQNLNTTICKQMRTFMIRRFLKNQFWAESTYRQNWIHLSIFPIENENWLKNWRKSSNKKWIWSILISVLFVHLMTIWSVQWSMDSGGTVTC